MKKFSEENFLHDLGTQSWEHVYFFADNPSTKWEIWKDLFLQVLDKHVPLQSKKIKSKRSPWISSDIKHLMTARDNLKRKAIITKLETDWEDYKKARNETNTLLRQAKRDYYSKKIYSEKQIKYYSCLEDN
jgi:hypothetical protein